MILSSEDSKLLPCPFCGQKPFEGHTGNGQFTAKCYNCDVVMIQDRKDKLESLWNQRNKHDNSV